MMDYNDVDDYINSLLKNFDGLSHSAFMSPNRPLDGAGAFQVPSDKVWVRWYTNYRTVITGMGDTPCDRWWGVLTFQIFTPKGQGTRTANDLTYKLSKHFAYKSYADVEFFEAERTYQGSNDTEYQTNLDVRFRVR